jgi:hypothetical protein
MKNYSHQTGVSIRRAAQFAAMLACAPVMLIAAGRSKAPANMAGQTVLDATGNHVNYSREQLTPGPLKPLANAPAFPGRPFGPADATQQPFWQYAIFGSGIGLSNILVGPTPGGGGAPEILIGGSSGGGFGGDDFWQSIRRNSGTGNYDQVFVSPVYSASIARIALANVTGDSNQEIVVMLSDGRIYFYDFATKNTLGFISTGKIHKQGVVVEVLLG